MGTESFHAFSEQLSSKQLAAGNQSVHPHCSPNDSDTVFGLLPLRFKVRALKMLREDQGPDGVDSGFCGHEQLL